MAKSHHNNQLGSVAEIQSGNHLLNLSVSGMAGVSDEQNRASLRPPDSPTQSDISDVFCELNSPAAISASGALEDEIETHSCAEHTADSNESTGDMHLKCGGDAHQESDGSSQERGSKHRVDIEQVEHSSENHTSKSKCDVEELGHEEISPKEVPLDLVEEADNLIDAIKQDRIDAVEKLLGEGCDPNEPKDIEGNRPLHWAVLSRNSRAIELLIAAHVDVNLCGKNKTTPLMVAPTIYHPSKFKDKNIEFGDIYKILNANCDVDAMNENSRTVLHSAVQFGNVELVKILMEYNVDINICDAKARSPVMYAAMLSGANILQYTTEYTFKEIETIAYILIKANADVARCDKFRLNCLSHAFPNIELCDQNRIQRVSLHIIEMLVLAGAKLPPKRFLRRWSSVRKQVSQHVQKAIAWIEMQRTQIKPLQHCCRLTIRKALGQHIQLRMGGLQIPDRMKHFVLMPELDDILDLVNQPA